ncbi:hypothetical protein [Kitasatospora azatica]|uniref:hypothetical protein n=1 Tax=Kitasatospora azatica TaxID=58347 RepID=UPI0005698AE1|nr:hypothetical protein [Kitasatospora azatica]
MTKRSATGPTRTPPRRLRKASGLVVAALAVVGLMHLLPAERAAADSPGGRPAVTGPDRVGLNRGPGRELLGELLRRHVRTHGRGSSHHHRP